MANEEIIQKLIDKVRNRGNTSERESRVIEFPVIPAGTENVCPLYNSEPCRGVLERSDINLDECFKLCAGNYESCGSYKAVEMGFGSIESAVG